MEDTSKPSIDVEDVLAKLRMDEKISLISGADLWHTFAVPRLGVPSIRVSDGPNGVRGTRFFNGVPAACFPCGTGIASTWDVDLVYKSGALQGEEAKAKGASVILGPTANMQRSPLGGRGFESYSEDPYLSGSMSAAAVNGIQSTGVAATMKHFVCNDQEHERQSVNSIVTERALREIYLMPFMIAERDSRPDCYMTSYGRLNGLHCSEDPRLLQDILRDEWKFDGMVMSDWFGTYSTTESIKAGLDLEMPGSSYIRGKLVDQALGCRKLLPRDIDERVRQVLKLVKKAQALGLPERATEGDLDTPETAATLRKLASSTLVLLKNEKNVLPFKKDKTTAVIGPNASFAAYSGGGSASLEPYYAVTPLQGVKAQVKNVKYALGAPAWKQLPLLSFACQRKDGKQGLDMKVYLDPSSAKNRQLVDDFPIRKSEIILIDYSHPKLEGPLYYVDLSGTFEPEETAEYQFSLSVAGTGKLFVNGEMVVDNETHQKPGTTFFGAGTVEEIGTIKMEQGKKYDILVTFGTFPTQKFKNPGTTGFGAGGLRIGASRKINRAQELERAVKLAKEVDQVVLNVGLNGDWESEGYDRPNMDLPEGSDELIQAVLSANPNTAVVVQSGTPVTMTKWLYQSPAIVQAWFGGNETGNAIADILFGDVNPGGKLPLTFPLRNADNPAFLNFRSEKGRALYGEDVYIGYRFYEQTQKEVAFPFGHGLSYTSFEMKDLSVKEISALTERGSSSAASEFEHIPSEDEIHVSVNVTNTGSIPGSEVVQVYVAQNSPSINRPPKELKGFAKVYLEAGESKAVEVSINKKYATSFWDEERDKWVMEKDTYQVLVGNSSADTPLRGEFEVKETKWWRGL